MISAAVKEYVKLEQQLALLIEQGHGDSADADHLRDQMDGPWYAMTEQERQERNRVVASAALLEPLEGLTDARKHVRAALNRWEAERKQKRDATLTSVRLWIKRHLETLHARSNSTGPGLKANGYSVAEIPDWELRQMLESVEEELGLKPAQETNATEARESSSPTVR